MRYLLMTTDDDSAGGPPDEKLMAEMGAFIDEMTRSGALLATGGLDPRVKKISATRDGKFTVTDGPFSEAKEQVVGFALIDVRDEAEALELSRRFYAITGGGEGTMQRVFGPGDEFPG
ncbi:YciI family protein [Actinomadura atramentaria]|uniref:YciI family protein n=1 Tax=Actinomadura atramentaria TaxID=1990 RepID=UPI00036394CA|nr:YciI family protein [Actinomadura atramentaria]